MTETRTEGRRYSFHPRERRGVILGLQAGQLGALATGVVLALGVVQVAPSRAGLAAALAILVVTLAGACWPVLGRPLLAWALIGVAWLRRRQGAPRRARVPADGHRLRATVSTISPAGVTGIAPLTRSPSWAVHPGVVASPRRRRSRRRDTLPRGIRLLAARELPGAAPMGVVHDQIAGSWAAVLRVQGRSFSLLDPLAQDRRLASWGAVLAGLARTGSPVHRLQWVERTVPGDSEALTRYLDHAAPAGSPGPPEPSGGAARSSYADLVAGAGPLTQDHETLLVVAVRPRRTASSLRTPGRTSDAVEDVLRREIHLLQGQLRAAELSGGAVLSSDELVHSVRVGVEPARHGRGARRGGTAPGAAGAWPMASDEAWAAWRADGFWHVTYWIAEWPRVPVGPDFLAPVLLSGGRRAMAVTMAPIGSERAVREVESARTADLADDELRRRTGFVNTARRQREAEGVRQREAELADGHAEFRFSGYLTVSAPTRVELDATCAGVEQAAQHAHLELRRLFGQQAEAFTWTLPLARGLS